MSLGYYKSGKPIPELETTYAGKGYGEFKTDLAEAIVHGLDSFQKKFAGFTASPDVLVSILRDGAARAAAMAEKTLSDVKQKIGFLG